MFHYTSLDEILTFEKYANDAKYHTQILIRMAMQQEGGMQHLLSHQMGDVPIPWSMVMPGHVGAADIRRWDTWPH